MADQKKRQKVALLSVFNKEGIAELAAALVDMGWRVISSGGTAKVIAAADVPAEDVAALVGGAAILKGRVKTLARELYGGILATDSADDLADLEKEGISRIDLVCCDMYPLKEEISNPECTMESVIEKTDIGGPTMLRAAAKGRRITMCDAADRPRVIEWLKAGEPDRENFITELAAKAEAVIADYCLASAVFHGKGEFAGIVGRRVLICKYGENAYQAPAALYSTGSDDPLALDKFQVVSGTDPSFNNECDIDRIVQTITHVAATFDINRGKVPLTAVSVKHGNACGAAIGESAIEIVQKMVMGDQLAIFGGFVMLNFTVTEDIADMLLSHGMSEGRRLLDGIIAPSFADGTIEMLKRKKDKCRLIVNPALASLDRNSLDDAPRIRYVRGGFLGQPNYTFILDLNSPDLIKIGKATREQEDDMLLAKAICDTSNSNTITIINNVALIGNGVGQQARVHGSNLALTRAKSGGHSVVGASAASDSFFPELDGVEVLVEAGVTAIITSSGSLKDKKVIAFCEEKGIALYMIPDKIGRGFYNH